MGKTHRKHQGKKYRDGKYPEEHKYYQECQHCLPSIKRKKQDKISKQELKRELRNLNY